MSLSKIPLALPGEREENRARRRGLLATLRQLPIWENSKAWWSEVSYALFDSKNIDDSIVIFAPGCKPGVTGITHIFPR